jgi:hypothetical protein
MIKFDNKNASFRLRLPAFKFFFVRAGQCFGNKSFLSGVSINEQEG